MATNKKMVKAISKAVAGTRKEMMVLEKKGKKAVAAVKKNWKASAPKRAILKAQAKKTIKKIEAKSGTAFRKSVQFEKDVMKGVKQGVKLGIKHSKKIK